MDKQYPAICCLQETHLKSKDTQVKSKTMEKDEFMQIVTTRVGETMLISDKIDFNSNTVKKNKEIMIKGSIHHICTKHQSS